MGATFYQQANVLCYTVVDESLTSFDIGALRCVATLFARYFELTESNEVGYNDSLNLVFYSFCGSHRWRVCLVIIFMLFCCGVQIFLCNFFLCYVSFFSLNNTETIFSKGYSSSYSFLIQINNHHNNVIIITLK